MTDQTQDQGAPGYTAEQVTGFNSEIDAMVSAGHMTEDAAAAARAELTGQAPAKPNGGTPDPAPASPDADQALARGGDFSPREIEAMKIDLMGAVARGQLSMEQMNAQLEQANGGPVTEPNAEDPATLSEQAAAIDAAAPPAKASDYDMPGYSNGFDAEERQLDAAFRNWLHQGRFDRAIGSNLAQHVNEIAQKIDGMSDAEIATWSQHEKVLFQERFGPGAIGEVQQFLADWSKREGCSNIIPFLSSTGVMGSSYFASQVLMHARRQAARVKQ